MSTGLKIEIASELDLLETVKQAFDDFLDAMSVDGEDFRYWCWVGIQEALVNAIRHGNLQRAELPVIFSVEISGAGIRLTVTDQGNGLVLDELPDPTAPENLLRSSGRGFLFIQNAMDRVSTKREPGAFTLIMEKDFGGS